MLSSAQVLSTHHQEVQVMALTIFLSHSTQDDAIVAALRTALEAHGVVCFRQARVNLDLQWPTVILRT